MIDATPRQSPASPLVLEFAVGPPPRRRPLRRIRAAITRRPAPIATEPAHETDGPTNLDAETATFMPEAIEPAIQPEQPPREPDVQPNHDVAWLEELYGIPSRDLYPGGPASRERDERASSALAVLVVVDPPGITPIDEPSPAEPAPLATAGSRVVVQESGAAARSIRNAASRAVAITCSLLMWLAALAGLAAMVITVASTAIGIRPVIIRSGSMEPAIPTGSVVMVRRVGVAELKAGEVVSITRPDGIRITHRVVSIRHMGTRAELVLKGDANDDADPQPVVVKNAYRVVATLPKLGWLAAHVATPVGGFALGCIITAGFLAPNRRARRRRPATA